MIRQTLLAALPDVARQAALAAVLLGCSPLAIAESGPSSAGSAPRRVNGPSLPTVPVGPALGAQSTSDESPSPSTKSIPEATSVPESKAGGPVVTVEAPCDYWIVSSRHLPVNAAPGDASALSFFHREAGGGLAPQSRDTFLASLRPDVPVCFVVHGSYNWWRDVVNESRRIHRWIRSGSPEAPLQVVFFTWPSDGNMPFIFPVDIALLGRKSSQHALYLAGLITQIPPEQPVSIVGHSHGARSAVAALHALGGGSVEGGHALPAGYQVPHRLQTVLIAAAIDHNWLNPGQRYGQALVVPERVLLMRNSRDATLAIYPARKIFGDRALGRDGLTRSDRLLLGEMGKKVVELDAAEFASYNHSFADYHERPELATAIVPYVYFEEPGTPGLPRATARPPASTAPTKTAPDRPAAGPAGDEPEIPPLKLGPELEAPTKITPASRKSSAKNRAPAATKPSGKSSRSSNPDVKIWLEP